MTKMIVVCPVVPWYEFHECDITTCKNHTLETEHHCIELDRRKPEGTKQFSDAELNLYKFKHRKISTRLVQIHRKNAVQAVKSILILHKFLEWIEENYVPSSKFSHPDLKKLELETPLKIKRLGWKNWMWEYVLDDKVWTKFISRSDGECKAFEIHQLLGIKVTQYEELLNHFKQTRRKGSAT